MNSWVLHKQWSGETSANITFLTRDKGIVRAICKGGRLPKKQALLQAFNPLWVTFREYKTSFYVQHLESAATTLLLEGEHLLAGLYVNELIYRALKPLDAAPTTFDAYEQTIQTLATAMKPFELAKVLRQFEWTLLTEMGYTFSLTHEARTNHPISPDNTYLLIAEEGLVHAPKGLLGAHILGITQNQWDNALVRQTAKTLLRLALEHALSGQIPQTRTWLNKQ